ncbi:1502_t:CDS:10 [Ambispora gerdemannii]|uniref:DNA-directed RNA polymerase III subunit RPC3 n=1 Tax=Ambispora gerdemannii TaxID=144530 RepID=A0A9N8V5S7_9GLOM|nr:1502_t:CDS:10 [Ambispora gerdemannii]
MGDIARLCRFIIRDDFGDIVAKVAKVLLEKGRLSFLSIRRFTKLDVKSIKENLVILMQHNMVYYAEITENNRTIVYYHLDMREVLARQRIGLYLWHSKNLHNVELAPAIIYYILLNGKGTLKGVLSHYFYEKDAEGPDSTKNKTIIKRSFEKLIREHYLLPVFREDTISALDKRNEQEQKALIERQLILPTKKEMSDIRSKIDSDIRNADKAAQSLKRKADDNLESSDSNKMLKTDETVDENTYYRVNYERFNIRSRNAQIAAFAGERINESAKCVMRRILEIADDPNSKIEAAESGQLSKTTITKKIPQSARIGDYIVFDGISRNPSHEYIVDQYLQLLTEDEAKFIRRKDSTASYSVRYKELCQKMKQRKLETFLQEKYGSESVRILRILTTKGKLDEKNIASFALMGQPETRKLVDQLFVGGFVELQEVPKVAERTPSRTFYLWYVDLNKCYQRMISDVYRTLGNIHERRLYETAVRNGLIEKKERAEEMRNPDLLSDADKDALYVFNGLLNKLDLAELRLVELEMLMSDFV